MEEVALSRIARLDGDAVTLTGTLRDRIGTVVTFSARLEIHAGYSVELGELPPDCDPSWQKARTR